MASPLPTLSPPVEVTLHGNKADVIFPRLLKHSRVLTTFMYYRAVRAAHGQQHHLEGDLQRQHDHAHREAQLQEESGRSCKNESKSYIVLSAEVGARKKPFCGSRARIWSLHVALYILNF